MKRRTLFGFPAILLGQRRPAPRILLRSSWQSVNIGDIGHTPGALSLIWKYLPDAEITLWPGKLGHGSREMLMSGYPKLKIVEGTLDKAGQPMQPELQRAWAETDLYLSGSGSGFPASQHAVAFQKATAKPVGVFGVSNDPISGLGAGKDAEGGTLKSLRERALALPPTHLEADLRYIIDRSAFFFCRDTITRDYLKAQGVKTPVLEFGPDAQLGMHLKDEARGLKWMKDHGLEADQFIAVVPRLRYTPYYLVNQVPRVPTDDIRDAINNRTAEADHAKLREMMIAYVRKTGRKVMVCAEMTYQVELGKRLLVDPLPEEIRKNVVWRDTYWLPDEAASIYARAQAVVSAECHSPLIALKSGTPTFYVRQPSDTCKGQMYRDIGAGDWFFEVDQTTGGELWARLDRVVSQPKAARAQVASIMREVETKQKRMVEVLGRAVVGSKG